MSSRRDDAELRFGPGAVQIVSGNDRAYRIVTPLDDHGRNVANALDILQQRIIRQEDVVAEIVRFDTGQAQRDDDALAVSTQLNLRCD